MRAVEPSDADLIWEVESDSSQWQENGMMAPYSRRVIKEYAEGYDADPIRAGQLRMVAEADGKPVGLFDLYNISVQNRTAFIGIYIIGESRGKGFAARGLRLMESYARQLLNLRILAAKVAETNEASIRLFDAEGYTYCGQLRNWLLTGSTPLNLRLYEKEL